MTDTMGEELDGIAVIAMSGRFPGAADIEQYWRNLCDGVESIAFFDADDLRAADVDPHISARPEYVPAAGVLDDVELFDAEFFRYAPREAELIDPQHRLFLETAWQAIESAGYDPSGYPGAVGVYAGTEMSSYLLNNLLPGSNERPGVAGSYDLMISNTSDFLPLRVSYRLGLGGPSMCVQTACSTSLVAVHLACQSLRSGECDLALAGGATVAVPQRRGYLGSQEGILSPDGHCRAFDAAARGTLPGNGVGIVVLKRLEDALADRDQVRAVIRGSAVNNDGSLKAGFTAPSMQAQSAVVAEALAMAGVGAGSVGYVEAHGTGTRLGDPIEVAALTRAFRESASGVGFCAVGSVKTNVGHLDAAAGVAGLIKAVLMVERGKLPPSLHFVQPNPEIDFAGSPFYVNTELREWRGGDTPRRAGISSFGIGGTNAHVVIEEPPAVAPSDAARSHQLVVLSARTPEALDRATADLATHLQRCSELDLADVAHTLRSRHAFDHRRVLVATGMADAVERLRTAAVHEGRVRETDPAIGFLFSGQGSQYTGMTSRLYGAEPYFRSELDQCARILNTGSGLDLLGLLHSTDGSAGLVSTRYAQPALFAIEYSLARQWAAWGIHPAAMAGHSVGEFVAACLAGVFTLEDALRVVAERGRLMQGAEQGAMLSVALGEAQARQLLGDELDLAAVNAVDQCVLSGPMAAIDALRERLKADGVHCVRLRTSHAFHSAGMQPVLTRFEEIVGSVARAEPGIPYVSNVTGTWITPQQATSPRYWAQHLRGTVRFSEGLGTLWSSCNIALEVGPGERLADLARAHPGRPADAPVLTSLPGPRSPEQEEVNLTRALGRLWAAGARPDWTAYTAGERRSRVALPTYPFERRRYWVDAVPGYASRTPGTPARASDPADWLSLPGWAQASVPVPARQSEAGDWLVFADETGLADRVVARLRERGHHVEVVVTEADPSARSDGACDPYTVDPGNPADYTALVEALTKDGHLPTNVVHLWGVTGCPEPARGLADRLATIERETDLGFRSLMALQRALADGHTHDTVRLTLVTTGMRSVTGDEKLLPGRATALGPCMVIPLENGNVRCASVDVSVASNPAALDRTAEQVLAESLAGSAEPIVAYRGARRWIPAMRPHRPRPEDAPPFRPGGVYVITGGLGGIGLAVAEHLARTVQAKLILVGRRGLPPEEERGIWSSDQDSGAGPGQAIQRVKQIRALGAEVMVHAADVTDYDRMREVVEAARERFGEIHGVVHAAGVPGSGLIQQTTHADNDMVLSPKVRGTLILHELLAGDELDFFALMSSHSSLVGDLGQADYAAANAFLDAFAQDLRGRGMPVVSVNWDMWRQSGMAVRGLDRLRHGRPAPSDMDDAHTRSTAAQLAEADVGLSDAEGVAALEHALSAGQPQVVVTTTGHVRAAAPATTDSTWGGSTPGGRTGRRHARQLATPYVAPDTPSQHAIATMWSELLGVHPVGAHDDFFELGGHSLLATQLISRLSEDFGVTLPLHTFLEHRTVATLAECIDTLVWTRAGREHVPDETAGWDEGEL